MLLTAKVVRRMASGHTVSRVTRQAPS